MRLPDTKPMTGLLTLILAVSALNFLMDTFLYLSLQDPRSLWLVVIGYFENVCCIDPTVLAASHDMAATNIEFKDGDLQDISVCAF